jgi:restriction endonuclease S subunit
MNSKPILKKTLKTISLKIKRGLSSYYNTTEGTTVNLINIRDIQQNRVVLDTVESVSVKETSALENSTIEENDLILTIKGNTFKSAVADKSVKGFVISANLIAFTLDKEINPHIVSAYLNSAIGQKELQSRAGGAVQKALNMKSLLDLEIPILPLNKQQVFSKYLSLSQEYDELLVKEQELRRKINSAIVQTYMG